MFKNTELSALTRKIILKYKYLMYKILFFITGLWIYWYTSIKYTATFFVCMYYIKSMNKNEAINNLCTCNLFPFNRWSFFIYLFF